MSFLFFMYFEIVCCQVVEKLIYVGFQGVYVVEGCVLLFLDRILCMIL